MLELIIHKVIALAIKYDVIGEEETELYFFSYSIMLEQLLTFITILILSGFVNYFAETVIYLAMFIPLRIHAGGYHARTFTRCYFLSISVYAIFAFAVGHINIPGYVFWVIVILSAIVIFLIAPVADPNKPIDEDSRKKYKVITRMLLIVELVGLTAVCVFMGVNKTVLFMGFTFLHLAFLVAVGQVVFRNLR